MRQVRVKWKAAEPKYTTICIWRRNWLRSQLLHQSATQECHWLAKPSRNLKGRPCLGEPWDQGISMHVDLHSQPRDVCFFINCHC